MSNGNGTIALICEVWRIIGWKRVLRAWYTWGAVVVSCLCWSLWKDGPWWDTSLAIVPGMLGFSLAGFAMILAFGNDAFRNLLSRAKTDRGHSAFMGYAAVFVHYIAAQVLGLLLALLAKADWNIYPSAGESVRVLIAFCHFVGFFFVTYSIFLALAATFAIFRMARVADELQGEPLDETGPTMQECCDAIAKPVVDAQEAKQQDASTRVKSS